METPGSLANSAQAATLIQRAFRGAQRRIAAEQEDLAAILISMEEAEEARINARQSVMHTVNRTLEEFITSVEMKLRGGGEGEDTKRVLATKTLRKRELPTLTADSIENLISGLSNDERIAMVDALAILQAATVLFMNEPSVCDITVPKDGRCFVVGDLHGQLDDLLHIFRKLGMPSSDNIFIFNGDLVDRGDHSCEIVLLIFALKLRCPDAVFVNRGNHEEPHINIYGGFEEECVAKYDHGVFQAYHAAFLWLPYACVVNGRALVLHAGLPADETVGVSHVRSLARGPDVCSEEANWGKEGWIRDMLWSDPHPDPEFRGMEQSARGAGVLWGEDATIAFLERENLSAIVRSHQCVPNGVAIQHGGRVFTVFSASNYCGSSGNLGAVLIFRHGNDRPTETYQWDPYKDPKMSGTIITKRSGKELKRAAAVQQATEYIVEHRAALLAYFRRGDPRKTGWVSFHGWAKALAQVLQVRLAWNKLVSSLVGPDDMDASCDGVLYERWLRRFSVELKGGCREWQEEVVAKISSAVLQSGGNLRRAFREIDADGSGEISAEEFRVAVRRRLPSLAVLSDTQLEAVVNAFDADGSGQVDAAEFESLLTSHIARTTGRAARDAGASNPSDTSRDARAVVGLQWRTRVDDDEASDRGDGAHAGGGDSAGPDRLERALASAVSRLFYTHRRELFHIWHSHFDPEGTGSIAADEFVAAIRALDAADGTGMLSEEATARLAETLDDDGNGRIDFVEFARNIGGLVERVLGTRALKASA